MRPIYIEIEEPIAGLEIDICWNCAYEDCTHCDNHFGCQHTHWWKNAKISKAEAISARRATSGVRPSSEQSGQLDLFAASRNDSPDPYLVST
jgi:hypothetical protein